VSLHSYDVDGDQLTTNITTLPMAGELWVNGTLVTSVPVPVHDTSSDVVFVPGKDENGMGYASFQFAVSDGLLSDVGTITVNVHPVNDAPVVLAGSAVGMEDVPLVITLNATDQESPTTDLTLTVTAVPSIGKLFQYDANEVNSAGTRITEPETVVTDVEHRVVFIGLR
jgi:cadherin-like protein